MFRISAAIFIVTIVTGCSLGLEHPYTFEKPLNDHGVLLQRQGLRFAQNQGRRRFDEKVIEHDFVEKYENTDSIVERDRSTSGESEIRSKIVDAKVIRPKNRNATTLNKSQNDLKVESKELLPSNHSTVVDDLDASSSLPEPQSLRRKNIEQPMNRLKNHKSETRPPNRRKPLPPISNYDDDDDEYYYVYEYYDDDEDLPPLKPPINRRPQNKISSPNFVKEHGSIRQKNGPVNTRPTPPPLYSPATQPPIMKPARQGLLADDNLGYPMSSSSYRKFGSGSGSMKSDRKPEIGNDPEMDEVGTNQRYDTFEADDDDEYEYDFEVVENKAKRRSDGYGDEGGGINPLALLIAPLVGISLLTAAVAVALNPVLVSVSLTGKRRKRKKRNVDAGAGDLRIQQKVHEIKVLERFLGTIPDDVHYQQTILSMYLSCSGYTDASNRCLDRVVCEYSNPESSISQEDRDVVSIVLYNIMANKLVAEDFKERLRTSARLGRDAKNCRNEFACQELESIETTKTAKTKTANSKIQQLTQNYVQPLEKN